MSYYSEVEILSLIDRFEKQELPKVEWTHEAHLLVAIWYMSKFNFETALETVRDYITRHNISVGTLNTDSEGYHETITKFWLLVAGEFLRNNRFESVPEAVNDFIGSEFSESKYPLEFYTEYRLFSVKARHHWLEPDKQKWTGRQG